MAKKKKQAAAKKDTQEKKQQDDAGQSAAAKADTGKPRVKKSKQLSKEESVKSLDMAIKKIFEKVDDPVHYRKIADLALVSGVWKPCLLYTSPSPRDRQKSRMPSSA